MSRDSYRESEHVDDVLQHYTRLCHYYGLTPRLEMKHVQRYLQDSRALAQALGQNLDPELRKNVRLLREALHLSLRDWAPPRLDWPAN